MEGIYTDDPLMYVTDTPDFNREYSTLRVPWEGWTESVDLSMSQNDAYANQTLLFDEPVETYTEQTVNQILPFDEPVETYTEQTVNQILPFDEPVETCTEQTATDWGYAVPTAIIDEPPRLNKRGMPMRHSAMQVGERVQSIVKWENATEDSMAVREIASAIDQEITQESSHKRIRLDKPEVDHVTYDSELSDGADGESENEQGSEPDPDETDSDFMVADEDKEDDVYEVGEEGEDDDDKYEEDESEIEETEEDESGDETDIDSAESVATNDI
jgi:hypothetical protein